MISKKEAFAGSAIIVLGIAVAGAKFSTAGNWYESIKPAFAPPNYIFGIVWSILYILIALSLGLAITAVRKKPYSRKLIYSLFAINLLANLLWSFLFFARHFVAWALVDVIVMDLTAIMLMFGLYRLNKGASLLLLPYILWILFATLLNIQILLG